MDPDLAARYQARLGQEAFEIGCFLLFTYVPLQAAAIWSMRHTIARIAAGLPILPMLPVIISGVQPNTHRDGSLYGILLMGAYGPAMVYLAIFLVVGLAFRAARAKGQTPVVAASSDVAADPPPSEQA